MQEFTLKQQVTKSSLYGQSQPSYEYVDVIDVDVSVTDISIVHEGVVYTKEQTIGLTLFECFEKNEKYSLWDGLDKVYDIITFKPGRFTQLVLQEVI